MKKKMCPVCDLPVNELNYCPRCRRVVKKTVEWEMNYYLNEKEPTHHYPAESQSRPIQQVNAVEEYKRAEKRGQTGRKLDRRLDRRNVEIITFAVSLVVFIAVSFSFIMIASVSRSEKAYSEEVYDDYDFSGEPDFSEDEDIYDEYGYLELDESEVRDAGIACTGYDHFDVNGVEVADSMWNFLNQSGFNYRFVKLDVYSHNYEINYEEDGPYSYYETVQGINIEDADSQLTSSDENYVYQYVDINYDTATGHLHDYVSSLKNKEASFTYLEEFLRIAETASGISEEDSRIESIMEQVRANAEQENGAYILEGIFDINVYPDEDVLRIYVCYNNPLTVQDQET